MGSSSPFRSLADVSLGGEGDGGFEKSRTPSSSVNPSYEGFSSNTTCMDSSTVLVLKLYTLYVLLLREYPMKIPTSAFGSNLPKFTFPLLWM